MDTICLGCLGSCVLSPSFGSGLKGQTLKVYPISKCSVTIQKWTTGKCDKAPAQK